MLCRLTERVTDNVLAQGMVLFAVPSKKDSLSPKG